MKKPGPTLSFTVRPDVALSKQIEQRGWLLVSAARYRRDSRDLNLPEERRATCRIIYKAMVRTLKRWPRIRLRILL